MRPFPATSLVLSCFMYIFFFHDLLRPDTFFWGSDAKIEYYPARVYLYKTIMEENRFPFWTEKMYSGFPIYADLENSYLNPINVLLILILGPALSYKVVHFLTYLFGSFALYLFLRNRRVGIFGYAFANLIFYFNSFMINHQIHFGIIMSLYLLPALLYFYDKYLSCFRLRYLVYISIVLSYNFLWGHIQTFLLGSLAFFLYKFVSDFGKIRFVSSVLTSFFIIFLTTTICLPQIVPTYILGQRSIRSLGNVSGFQGVLPPRFLVMLVYPFVFSTDTDTGKYSGNSFDSSYSTVETNIYMGVSVIIIYLIGVALVKDMRIKLFSFLLFMFFSFVAFAKYVWFINFENISLFHYFRYWLRAISIVSLGFALVVALFVDSSYSARVKAKEVFFSALLIVTAFIYWFGMFYNNTYSGKNIKALDYIVKAFEPSADINTWKLILVCTCTLSLLMVMLKNSIFILPLRILLLLLILTDYTWSSEYLIRLRVQKLPEVGRGINIPNSQGVRAIIKSDGMRGMESLYYPNWSPYGYSQLADAKYTKRFLGSGVADIKDPQKTYIAPERIDIWKSFGVALVAKGYDVLYRRNPDYIDIFEQDILGSYIKKSEGDIVVKTDTSEPLTVRTYIKNYPGWEVTINGTKVALIQKPSDMFISFNLPEGINVVRLRFIPRDFYYSVTISIAVLAAVIVVWLVMRTKNLKFIH